jgi:hypothetical protein
VGPGWRKLLATAQRAPGELGNAALTTRARLGEKGVASAAVERLQAGEMPLDAACELIEKSKDRSVRGALEARLQALPGSAMRDRNRLRQCVARLR